MEPSKARIRTKARTTTESFSALRQGISTTRPNAARLSMYAWAAAASASGKRRSMIDLELALRQIREDPVEHGAHARGGERDLRAEEHAGERAVAGRERRRVDLHVAAARVSDRDRAAAVAETQQAALQGVAADRVDHEVHAAVRREFAATRRRSRRRGRRCRGRRRSVASRSILSFEPAVANTVAPARFASCTHASPTPLPPAWISTVSPALQVAELEQTVVRGAPRHRHAGRVLEREPVGHEPGLRRRNGRARRVRAVEHERSDSVADLAVA